MIELFPHRAAALDCMVERQRHGYITSLRYHSEPGEWETWSCGWLVEWRMRDEPK